MDRAPAPQRRAGGRPAGLRALGQARLPAATRSTSTTASSSASWTSCGVERVQLVMHDWGAVGLAFAQRLPGARRAPGDHQRGAVPARLPLAPHGAHLAHARCSASWRWARPAASRCGSPRASPTRRRGRCRRRGSTACSSTSTRARSARSCACTAAPRRRCWRRPARAWGRSTCRRWSCGACATRTSRRASAREYAQALAHAELLELADAGHWPWLDRPDVIERVRGLPERRVSAAVPRTGHGAAERTAPSAVAERDSSRLPPAWTITAALARRLPDRSRRRAPTWPPRAIAATCSRAPASRCGTTPGTAATTCSPTRCSRPRWAR